MNNSLLGFSSQQLRRAAVIKDKIAKLEIQLAGVLGGSAPASVSGRARKKSQMSAAGRAKIALAQKARWAKYRAGKKKK